MIKQVEFEVSGKLLQDMGARGKSLMRMAEVFDGSFQKIATRLRAGKQVERYLCADLLQGYMLVQMHNRIHDQQAGKALADEVKKWQSAKIRVDYKEGLHPFLDCTEPITKRLNEVHAWFD